MWQVAGGSSRNSNNNCFNPLEKKKVVYLTVVFSLNLVSIGTKRCCSRSQPAQRWASLDGLNVQPTYVIVLSYLPCSYFLPMSYLPFATSYLCPAYHLLLPTYVLLTMCYFLPMSYLSCSYFLLMSYLPCSYFLLMSYLPCSYFLLTM